MCNMASVGYNGTSILMANASYNGSVEAADYDDTGAGLSSYDMAVHFNPTMAIIIVVLLAAFVFMGFFSVYIKKWANPTPPPPRMILRPLYLSSQGIDKAVIEALRIIQYTTEMVKELSMLASCCPVCLTEFEENESLRMLPQCGHCFHHACIDMWLLSHTTCPVRRSVLKISNHASPASEENPFVQSTDTHQDHICIDIGTERQRNSDARLFNHTGNSIKKNGESSQMNKSLREHSHPASSSEDVAKRNFSCNIPPDTTSENNPEATASFWVMRALQQVSGFLGFWALGKFLGYAGCFNSIAFNGFSLIEEKLVV